MNYQLVIQFLEELYGDLEWIADFEDRLDESLIDAEVDGHDIGSEQVNVFIHTSNPVNTFETVKSVLENEGVDLECVKVAYRELTGESYIPLWPEHLSDFKIV